MPEEVAEHRGGRQRLRRIEGSPAPIKEPFDECDPAPTAKDEEVAAAYQAYWLDFVRGGSADGKLRATGHPACPRYDAARDELLFVNKVGTLKLLQRLLATRFDYIEHHLFDHTAPLPTWSNACP